jgi:kynurenine formamidase
MGKILTLSRVVFSGAVVVATLAAASGCATRVAVPDLANTEMVDLTHPYDGDSIYWPTSPGQFELQALHRGPTEGGYWYEANTFCTPEHGGTHLDAPIHFAEGMWSVAEVPIERLVGPAVVIDVRAKSDADPDYTLTRDDVARFEVEHGRIPSGAIVILDTGYAKHWPDRRAYLGDDTPGDASRLHFPSFGAEAARWLIEERAVRALAVDTASIDPGSSKDFPVHRIAGAANVVGLENLVNLDRLPAKGAWVVALPMKIAGGSGAPVRAVAFLPHRQE